MLLEGEARPASSQGFERLLAIFVVAMVLELEYAPEPKFDPFCPPVSGNLDSSGVFASV